MKIAIISDIHDNVWNLNKALKMDELQTADAVLCCGDLCSPFIIKLLGEAYRRPIHIVFGNNDGDVNAIIKVASNYPNIFIHGEYFRGEFEGKTFAMNHYLDKAKMIAKTESYDVVCYGHDHTLVHDKYIGKTLFINPGAIMGYHGGQLKDITPSFLTLETKDLKCRVHEV